MGSNFIFSLNATVPVFVVMIVGYLLKRWGFVNDNFVEVANKISFQIFMPILVFNDLSKANFYELFDPKFVCFCAAATVSSILIIWGISRAVIRDKRLVGSFVQGAYRGSCALLGIALAQNIYGDASLASLMIVSTAPFYNVFAVIILTIEGDNGGAKMDREHVKGLLLSICKNPLIWGILFGLGFSLLRIQLPTIALKSLANLGQITSPLALIAIGAGFEFGAALERLRLSVVAGFIKLLLLPAVFLPVAVMLGFRDQALVAILIMLGSPTTVSAYIMAHNMHNDSALSSNIVVLTTLFAAVSLTLWIFLLRTLALI